MAARFGASSLTTPGWRELPQEKWTAARVAGVAQIRDVRLLRADMFARHFSWDEQLDADTNLELELTPPEGDEATFIVEATLSVRITSADAPPSDGEDDEATIVSCTYGALYEVPQGFNATREEYQAFTDTVAALALYPYAREFVQSSTSRMGLPPLTIPMLRQTIWGPEREVRGELT